MEQARTQVYLDRPRPGEQQGDRSRTIPERGPEPEQNPNLVFNTVCAK